MFRIRSSLGAPSMTMSNSSDALIPGYTLVDQFGADDEYGCDDDGQIVEEVEYVTLDLGFVEPTLVPSSSSYRLIGLDTPSPYLQLSGTTFKGQHQTLLGTELLFAEDGHERGAKSLAHIANTERRIKFREVELKPKKADDGIPPDSSQLDKPSTSSSKRKRPQTVEQFLGNETASEPVSRGGGRKGGRKSKRKIPDVGIEELHRADEIPELMEVDVGQEASVDVDVEATEVNASPSQKETSRTNYAADPMDITEG